MTDMKKVVLFFLCVLMTHLSILAQVGYTSENNSIGFWTNDGIWSRNQTWLPTTPGVNVGGATNFVDLHGYIVRDGDLTLEGGVLLTVYDTLWIMGDINITQSSSIDIQPGGILIVDRNFVVNGGTTATNNGNVIVTGNLTSSGSAAIDNSPEGVDGFFVYGTVSASGGATFNGSSDTSSGNMLGESDLSVNNSDLYNFVHTILPVQIISLDASFDGEKVKVQWATTLELKNDRFEIYRSIDEVDFKYLGKVTGHGNSSALIEYTFVDDRPLTGKSYYKIKQVDFDGEYTYSPPVAVHVNPPAIIFQVIPTKVKNGNVKFKIGNISQDTFRVTLNGLKGSLAFDKTISLQKGITREIELPGTHQLQNGIYLLTLHTDKDHHRKKVILEH